MKKIINLISTIIFTLFVSNLRAQSLDLMTNAEIYDYNIGDIFERKIAGYFSPPTYILDTIINKYYSANMDTLFYVSNSYSYTLPSCPPPCTGTSSVILGKITSVTNLYDTVGNGLGSKPYDFLCIDTAGYTGTWLDTTIYNPSYCNLKTTTIRYMNNGPQLNGACYVYFEPYYGFNIYGKGLGKIHNYYNTCSNGFSNCESGQVLVYYKKGNLSCWTLYQIYVTDIKTLSDNRFEFEIYPNPINTIVTIKSNQIGKQFVDLYDSRGMHLISQIMNDTSNINLSTFDNGIYTLIIKNDLGVFNKKLIIAR